MREDNMFGMFHRNAEADPADATDDTTLCHFIQALLAIPLITEYQVSNGKIPTLVFWNLNLTATATKCHRVFFFSFSFLQTINIKV